MSEALDRACKAAHAATIPAGRNIRPWEQVPERLRDLFRAEIAAALKVMADEIIGERVQDHDGGTLLLTALALSVQDQVPVRFDHVEPIERAAQAAYETWKPTVAWADQPAHIRNARIVETRAALKVMAKDILAVADDHFVSGKDLSVLTTILSQYLEWS